MKYSKGQRLVCVKRYSAYYLNNYVVGKTYTIIDNEYMSGSYFYKIPFDDNHYIYFKDKFKDSNNSLIEQNISCIDDYFITLEEYRKRKIEKLLTNNI